MRKWISGLHVLLICMAAFGFINLNCKQQKYFFT